MDPRTASGSDDRVFIAWPDTREGSQIYFTRALDAGASFAADMVIISYRAETTAEVSRI